MQVIALEECFASNAIRRPGDKPFEFTPVDGIVPAFLKVVDSKDSPAPQNIDIYAALSTDQIRRRLEDCMMKVPPLADRAHMVAMLAEVEGKEIAPPKTKTKKGEKK